jgi:2-polyprenyl-3-methyl-5-hydroxy-6-metoxy-1,4-benzoquinol methylase
LYKYESISDKVNKDLMANLYNQYYKTENLFGKPYPELIDFLANYPKKGKLLDVGCGQGRDAIPLARLGYNVIGIDNSMVGVEQMIEIGRAENLNLMGHVENIYDFDQFFEFDIILLDSMFHFNKKDKEKEIGFIKHIISKIKKGCLFVVCIQDTGDKVQTLNDTIDNQEPRKRLVDKKFKYIFEHRESGHKSETNYRMIVSEK